MFVKEVVEFYVFVVEGCEFEVWSCSVYLRSGVCKVSEFWFCCVWKVVYE